MIFVRCWEDVLVGVRLIYPSLEYDDQEGWMRDDTGMFWALMHAE